MSSIELGVAPVVHARRETITEINIQLRELNQRFPGERKKPDAQKDPEYMAQRNGILEKRQILQAIQYQDRRTLRAANGV